MRNPAQGPEKQAIAHAFSRAAASYDSVATTQRRIAGTLLARTPSIVGRVLDAGSGTGHNTRALRSHCPQAEVLPLDLALGMLHSQGEGLCADLEALPLADASIDLYWSSLAWQWADSARAIGEAARVLRAGGLLRVATLGPQTLHELRASFAQVDTARHVRNFTDAATLMAQLVAAGFQDVQLRRETLVEHHANLAQQMRSLRALGAHVVGPQRRRSLLGRQAWQRLEAHSEAQRQHAGLPASYDVIYLCAERGAC